MPGIRRTVILLAALWAPLAQASVALRPVVAQRSNYGESFTFVADLDDGGYVQLSLGLTNLGPGSLKAVCRAIVVAPDGKVWDAHTRAGRDGWSWHDGDDAERLVVGPCSASTDSRGMVVDVPLDGGAVRLTFEDRPVRRVLSDASFTVGDDFYRTEILLYRARVTGALAVPGAAPRTSAGSAYVDHTRSTIKPRDLADRWVRFRALRGDRGMVLLGRRGLDGRFTPVWACDPPGRCHRFSSFTVDRSDGSPSPSFLVRLPDDRDPLEIRSQRLLYRDAPVEALGLIGKLVAPFVGSPVTYVYRARLVESGSPPIDGILEVELSGE